MDTEDPMNFYYQNILRINPDQCQRFEGKANEFEIKIGKRFTLLGDFLEGKVQVVAIDTFSTKDFNDQIVECIPLPERNFYKRLYVELNRFWCSISHEGCAVGIIEKLQVYNGFPNLIDPEGFSKDPDEEFRRVRDELLDSDIKDIMVKPQLYQRIYFGFRRDFLENHSVRKRKNGFFERLFG